jgi:hypothetical protein
MSDLVYVIRDSLERWHGVTKGWATFNPYRFTTERALGALDELAAENETLRAALERVEEWTWEPGYERHALADLQNIARAALAAARGGDAA